MRQSIGSTWIMQLVIIFTLIFVAFISLTINYTRAFKTKNELVSMIEKYEGIGLGEETGAITIINNYLSYNNYSVQGKCEENEYGATSITSIALEPATNNKKYYYCVRKESTATSAMPNRARYRIRIFFHFSLPIIGDLFTFSVEGTTIDISHALNDIQST